MFPGTIISFGIRDVFRMRPGNDFGRIGADGCRPVYGDGSGSCGEPEIEQNEMSLVS